MACFIDKEKAINTLRRVCGECKRFYNCSDCRIEESLVALKDLPTADVVEVPCRCGKCRYGKLMGDKKTYVCIRQTAFKKADDYCSRGKRRDT